MQLNIADRFVTGSSTGPCSDQCYSPTVDHEAGMSPGAQVTSILAENHELKAQIEQLRAERTRWMEIQRRVMDLLHAQAPEKLVHDLRNLINERDLLKTLVDSL